MRIVICGGGVIGAATAYFLSRRGIEVIVVERTGLACAASGKAGGFLARGWCSGSPLDRLARRSFALHAELAATIDDDWGYRRLDTYAGFLDAPGRSSSHGGAGLPWLAGEVAVGGRIGSTEDTALVHPGAFTQAMMRAAERHGAVLRIGRVTGIGRSRDGASVQGVALEDGTIDADAVVVAMGPWSGLAAAWLPLPPVLGDKGHSLLFDTGTAISAEALFLEAHEPGGEVLTPEVFPRADGTTYVSAISSRSAVPLDPAEVAADPGALERLEALCERLSPALRRAQVVARQACYRPVTRDYLPLIGKIAGVAGAYVATGHSVWGILNAPATGEALAELILDGAARSVELRPFDPARLRPV
jgi:glycine/D-amino acid oxidase-like deaminating enzyme